MTIHAKPDLADKPALVVFGRDEVGKAHGSSFAEGEVKLAEKAAKLMNLRVLPVRTEVERALAARVPKGRVFASGRAFVPFIKASLFLELQTAALNSEVKPMTLLTGPTSGGGAEPPSAAPKPASPLKPSKANGTGPVKQPCGWADIQVGAIVLAAAPPRYLEWFECVVVATRGEDVFELRYCDWPDEPPFVRVGFRLA